MAVTVTQTFAPSGRVATILKPQTDRWLGRKMEDFANRARAGAPVSREPNSGRLKRSIRVVARDARGRFASVGGEATISSYALVVNVPHAVFVVRGTRPHVIRSRGPWPLRNRVTGQVFGPRVSHPGSKPNNFLDVALRQMGGF